MNLHNSFLVSCLVLNFSLNAGKEKELELKKYDFQFFGESSDNNDNPCIQLAIQQKSNLSLFNIIHAEENNNYLIPNYPAGGRYVGPYVPLNFEEPSTPEDRLGLELTSIVNEFTPNREELALFYERIGVRYVKQGYYTDPKTGHKIDFEDCFYDRLDKLGYAYREEMPDEFEIKEVTISKKTKDLLSKIMSKKAQKSLKSLCKKSQKE
jgi:hypothetical protein